MNNFHFITFQTCVENGAPITPCLLAIEQIFTEVLKHRDMVVDGKAAKPKGMCACDAVALYPLALGKSILMRFPFIFQMVAPTHNTVNG